MSAEVGSVSAVTMEGRSSTVTATNRATSRRPESGGATERSSSKAREKTEASDGSSAKEKTLLKVLLERAQNVVLSKNTTLSFEQDPSDGKIYIHVKDKNTGEVLYRVPRKYLANIESHLWQSQKLDLRV